MSLKKLIYFIKNYFEMYLKLTLRTGSRCDGSGYQTCLLVARPNKPVAKHSALSLVRGVAVYLNFKRNNSENSILSIKEGKS